MPYHHEHLRETLIDAALVLARTDGPEAVVLRATGRAAGVSHNAAYRHFADRDALLRAVCERCMSALAVLIETRMDELPAEADRAREAWARLETTGVAYVEFALSEPGWFRTAFAVPRGLDHFAPGEGVGHSGLNPYEHLRERLDRLVAVGELSAGHRPNAEYIAWAGVHGLATLFIDGPLRDLTDTERAAALAKVLAGIAGGLVDPGTAPASGYRQAASPTER